jgi:hypothetical protein
MLLIPCRLVELVPAVDGTAPKPPILRNAVFDADTGITYVETAPELVTVITGNGVQLSFKSSIADWCNKLIETAAAEEAEEEPEK